MNDEYNANSFVFKYISTLGRDYSKLLAAVKTTKLYTLNNAFGIYSTFSNLCIILVTEAADSCCIKCKTNSSTPQPLQAVPSNCRPSASI